jgi:hypothetical protein
MHLDPRSARTLLVLIACSGLGVACSGSSSSRKMDDGDGDAAAGGTGAGGRSPSGGGGAASGSGGATVGGGGAGGTASGGATPASGGGPSSGGATPGGGRRDASADASTPPEASADASTTPDASADASTIPDAGGMSAAAAGSDGGFFGVPTDITRYGCFIESGDGQDLLANGDTAVSVTSSPHSGPCNASRWISDNEFAYAPMTPPTTIAFRRAFTLGTAVADGIVTLSFKADDAIELVLNGHVVGTCTPPGSNLGACQQACTSVTFPSEFLKQGGAVNTLETRLVNLQSVLVSGQNYGYTAASYSVCVSPP